MLPLPASRFYVAADPNSTGLLIDYLVARFPSISRATWIDRLERGRVRNVDGTPLRPDAAVATGTTILYDREVADEPEPADEIRIVFQDERIVVVDKPPFIPVTPGGPYVKRSLLAMLRRATGLPDITPIHRLDRDTSGLVLFAIRACDRDRYHRLFAEHTIEREYHALARPPVREGTTWSVANRLETGTPWFRQRVVEGPVNAVTAIELIEERADACLYRLRPETGRKHQLRVHMTHLGTPIQDDRLYPELIDVAGDEPLRPLRLVASGMQFQDPMTGVPMAFRSTFTQRVLSLPMSEPDACQSSFAGSPISRPRSSAPPEPSSLQP